MNNSRVVSSGDGSKQLVTYSKIQQKIVRQNIRSEDEYLEDIGKIVRRDFFPDVAELSGEIVGDPLVDDSISSEPPTQNPQKNDTSMRLDKYLANNTTEDDASFIEILEESEKKREAKLARFFPSRSPSNALTAGEDTAPLAIEGPSSSKQIVKSSTSQKSLVPPTVDSITSHNSVHFNPDGAPLTANELTEHFNRERRICPENSRFKKPLAPVMDRRKFVNSAANRVGRFGIDGKEIMGSESPMATPHAGGFRFLDPNPSASPFTTGNATPLMTWGEVESTPYRLDEASGHTPLVSSFRLPSPSKREVLAHELADKAGRQRAKSRADAMKLAKNARLGILSPHAAAMAKACLSPAGKLLLSRTASGASLGFGGRPNSSVRSSGLGLTPKRLPSDIGVIRRPSTATRKAPQTPRTQPRDSDLDVSNPADLTKDLLNLSSSKNATSPE